MKELASAIFGFLAVSMIIQALFGLTFVLRLRSPCPSSVQNDSLPKAAVILPLRGADPFLADCVRALLNQNYPQYNLQIIVDSWEDPAWNIVSNAIQQLGAMHVIVSPLTLRHKTGSLKGSALVQAICALDDSYEVVAFVDADVVPHPNWLRELVAPLADEQVGASTGYRWYMPRTSQWGSLVRYIWNSAAVIFTCFRQYPWGGSMAMKLSVLRRSRLLKTWTQAVSVDAPIRKALQEIGLKVKFVPTVMMSNLEECNFVRCLGFMKRQLLVMRLYSSTWLQVAVQVFTTALAFVMAIGLLLIALVSGDFGCATWVAGAIAGYILAMVLLLTFLEQGVRRVIQVRGEPTTSFSPLMMAKILMAIPLTQLVFAVATLLAMLARSVEWRGITYQIEGPGKILLTEYRPYQLSNQVIDTTTSL